MTRDYAKSSLVRKKPKKKLSSFILWALVLLLFITLTFGLVYFGKHKQKMQTTKKITSLPKQQKETKIIKEVAIPQFDFYTILPQKNHNKSLTEYELEIMTVKNYSAADHLKAELTLLGFTVSITPIRKNGVQKYLVTVGPYDNKDGALADLARLKHNKINGRLKKIK